MRPRVILFAGLLLAPAARADPPPPTGAVESCTTSECHTSQTSFEFLHGPVAAGACVVCHAATDVAAHRFELKRTGAEACTFCHAGKTDAAGLNVHQPVSDGRCLECHDPHGSSHRMMINSGSTGDLCLGCHAQVSAGRHVHSPFAEGDCMGCHRAHTSIHADLLVEPGRALCLRCHADVVSEITSVPPSLPGAGTVFYADHQTTRAHEPVTGDCLQCHRPHAADVPALLTRAPAELCAGCHEDVSQHVLDAAHAHGATTDERACLNCHDAHTGQADHLLRAPPIDLCLSCHDRDITRTDGTILSSVADLAQPDSYRHAPVDEGSCRSCHDPHGGPFDFLLERPFTGSFYQAYDPMAYALCLECHDAAAFDTPRTTTLTRFRNGDLNLHYEHVVGPPKGGRSCRVCHTAHASASPKLLRKDVPFGEWRIPIGFKMTETGGSCASGCHRARGYDRVNPAILADPAPPQ